MSAYVGTGRIKSAGQERALKMSNSVWVLCLLHRLTVSIQQTSW